MYRNAAAAFALVALGLAGAPDAAKADGDAANGEKLFKRYCAACHTVEEGKHRVGPSLAGIFGAKAASVEGYKYSDPMMAHDVVWDEETLDPYLADPRGVVPGTKMTYAGVKKEDQREDIIAYLKSVGQ